MRATLQTLHYCKSHLDTKLDPPPDTPQLIFIYIIMVLLFLNTMGTTYDVMTGNREKSKIFSSFQLAVLAHVLPIPVVSNSITASSVAYRNRIMNQ